MGYFERYNKYLDVLTQCSTRCVCSHSMVMLESEPKTICRWCGRTVYNKNKLGQKQKFKDELNKAMKKKEKKNGTKNK